jgi:nicotinamidase/pyrazinamidase
LEPRVNRLSKHDAVIATDVQNDFCPGGALAVSKGDEVVPLLNRWMALAHESGATVAASRDWHPPDHMSFRQRGGPWPPHCVQNTRGAEFHPDLRLPEGTIIITKGADRDREDYSAFHHTDLAEQLRRRGVKRLWIGGLTTDYCVKESALDALKAGFEVHVIVAATRAVNVEPGDGDRAVAAMREAGAIIEAEE